MRRPIWYEVSAETKARLEGSACQVYKQHCDEVVQQYTEECSNTKGDDAAHELAFTRMQTEQERLEQQLDEADRVALDEECSVQGQNEDIGRAIESIWQIKKLPDNIGDIKAEQTFIEVMRLKYIYPDYADLVGPPLEEDFTEGFCRKIRKPIATLTAERKADLLLLGAFEWNGFYIAKPPSGYDIPKGWWVCLEPNFVLKAGLGAQRRSNQYDWYDRYRIKFEPFLDHTAACLADYLVACDSELGNRSPRSKHQRIRFADNNPYNCLPDNLKIVEKRGRKMRCQLCGKETTKEESKVLRDRGKKLRYCLDCLQR